MDDIPGVTRLRDRSEALMLRSILTAARSLFGEHGYARTTIRTIATEAGVVPQTIYAHFGSKAGVLTGLVDLLDDEAGLPDLIEQANATGDPAEVLGLLARASRQVYERCGDIVAMLRSGAAVEPSIAATRQESERRNRAGVEMAVARIREAGHRTEPAAADIAVALMSSDVYDRLVHEAGWSPDDYETWLAHTMARTVLG